MWISKLSKARKFSLGSFDANSLFVPQTACVARKERAQRFVRNFLAIAAITRQKKTVTPCALLKRSGRLRQRDAHRSK